MAEREARGPGRAPRFFAFQATLDLDEGFGLGLLLILAGGEPGPDVDGVGEALDILRGDVVQHREDLPEEGVQGELRVLLVDLPARAEARTMTFFRLETVWYFSSRPFSVMRLTFLEKALGEMPRRVATSTMLWFFSSFSRMYSIT